MVKASAVHPIGQMSFLQAALAEPLGCVLNGLDAVHQDWIKEALIFGAGPMALLIGLALKTQGVGPVAFVDIAQDRLELAQSFGFEAVASGSDALKGWHHRADLAVEATGVPQDASGLTNVMANGGKGLFFDVCPSDAKIDVAPFEVFRRQLTLTGSHSLNHNIPQALGVIASLGDEIDRAVSHRLSLEDVSGISSTKPPAGSLKVQWADD